MNSLRAYHRVFNLALGDSRYYSYDIRETRIHRLLGLTAPTGRSVLRRTIRVRSVSASCRLWLVFSELRLEVACWNVGSDSFGKLRRTHLPKICFSNGLLFPSVIRTVF